MVEDEDDAERTGKWRKDITGRMVDQQSFEGDVNANEESIRCERGRGCRNDG